MLPALNLSSLEHKQLKLDKLNNMFEKKLGGHTTPNRSSGMTSLEMDESLVANSTTPSSSQTTNSSSSVPSSRASSMSSSQQRTHRKYTKTSTPYVLVTSNGWTTPRGVNVSRVISSTLSWTSSFSAEPSPAASQPAAAAAAAAAVPPGFVPSKTNAKPFMQTYKINQNKRLPNQFASLRLSYASDKAAENSSYFRYHTHTHSNIIERLSNGFYSCLTNVSLKK